MLKYFSFILFFVLTFNTIAFTQARTSAKTSDAVIVYDKVTYQPIAGSSIPFDKRFTLQVLHGGTKFIKKIYVYEATFNGGFRRIVDNFPDFDLPFMVRGDTLNIFFPAIKPNVSFEVAVVSSLNGSLMDMATKINDDIYQNDIASILPDFLALQDSAEDLAMKISFFKYHNDLSAYQLFYNLKLSAAYDQLHNPGQYVMSAFPSMGDINLLENAFATNHIIFKDNNRLVRILSSSNQQTILDGTRTIKYDNGTEQTSEKDFPTRIVNLQASLVFFDTLTNSINASLAMQDNTDIRFIRNKIESISLALSHNKKLIHDNLDQINKAITDNNDLSAVDMLIGSTIAKNIKTAGGNIITMDLGLTNILTRDVRNNLKYIPKPYYGINIYFRPIDKDAREKDFVSHISSIGNSSNKIASTNSYKQHLSFGIGLTFTSMTNIEFDNLFNSATLLLGPGYRVGRLFKFGAGLALLKRVSKNPLISDKKVIGSFYLSLSADIDVVQGVKDFISIIFK